jgi:hypothetical protein
MNVVISQDFSCPWCGEMIETRVDTSQGDHTTVEDCTVCCRPIQLSIECEPGEVINVVAERG